MKNLLRLSSLVIGVLAFWFTGQLCVCPDFLIPFPEDVLMQALYGWGVAVGIVHGALIGSGCIIFTLFGDVTP
jgi:hypothetical protein